MMVKSKSLQAKEIVSARVLEAIFEDQQGGQLWLECG